MILNSSNAFNTLKFGNLKKEFFKTPCTEEEVNEYFFEIDRTTRALPDDLWDKIWSLSIDEKFSLADYLSATYLTRKTYKLADINKPKAMSPAINMLLSVGDVLDDNEKEMFKNKTQGAYDFDTLSKFINSNKHKEENFIGNLLFLKELLKKENAEVFDAISPLTATKILFNYLLTYDDFSSALSALKEDDALCLPLRLRNWFTYSSDGVQRYKRGVIHEYLLGESYKKIEDADELSIKISS